MTQKSCAVGMLNAILRNLNFSSNCACVAFKVAESSFQVPMPNLPLLSNYFCIGARFFARAKVNHRSIYSRILDRVYAVAMATGLVKNKA